MGDVIRVLLADDNATLREQLQTLIAAEPDLEVVGLAGDGQAAVERAQALRLDVVVMDLSMPVLNGLEATEQLRASCPAIRVVALTSHQDPSYVEGMRAAGAYGYVLKRSAAERLLEAIRVVAAGGTWYDPALPPATAPITPDRPATPDLPPTTLTADEQAVLQHTARLLTSQEIADALEMAVATVGALRAHAMAKLGLQGRVALAHYAASHGWL
jgi:two-component system, NarL family, response regulator NreC